MTKRKKFLPYITIFLFFLIITFLNPIGGDDWGNYLVGQKGIFYSIKNAIHYYNTWEGRFISRILINILTYNKIIWNIINSFLITSTIYLIIKLIKPKNKIMTPLILSISFLGMHPKTFAQTIMWLAGNITYLFVMPLFLFYVKLILEEKYKTKKIIQTILVSILNLIIPMFIEHIGVLLVAFNLFFIIYKFTKTKKLDKSLCLYLILSSIGLILTLTAPGQQCRSTFENLEFNNLDIFKKIRSNIGNFTNYTFFYNPFILILMSIANFVLIRKSTNNKIIKTSLLIYLVPIPILLGSQHILNELNIINIFEIKNWVVTLYFITYIIIDLLLIYFTYHDKNKDRLLLFIILGILANITMLVSPIWGPRTTFATYLFLSSGYITIIDNYIKENKFINITFTTIICIPIIFYIILYINIFRHQKFLSKSIKEQLKNNSQTIEISKFPSFITGYINPESEYHITTFKEYYNIPEEKELKLIDSNWKYKIFYIK